MKGNLMSKAEERTNEIIGEYHDGDYTDHSRHNTQWHSFCGGYKQAETDIIKEIENIIKWPPGENEVKKILRIEELLNNYK